MDGGARLKSCYVVDGFAYGIGITFRRQINDTLGVVRRLERMYIQRFFIE
jgi:hypothetical protein